MANCGLKANLNCKLQITNNELVSWLFVEFKVGGATSSEDVLVSSAAKRVKSDDGRTPSLSPGSACHCCVKSAHLSRLLHALSICKHPAARAVKQRRVPHAPSTCRSFIAVIGGVDLSPPNVNFHAPSGDIGRRRRL